MISIKIDEIQEGKKKEKMKRIFASYFVMFLCFLLLGLVAVQPSHSGADLFPMPIPNNKTVLVENNREAVSHIYNYRQLSATIGNYRQLVEWCEMERSFDLASQLWELSFVRSCGEEFVEAYNRNTMPPHLLWMMLNQPLCRDYLWMVTRNQQPVVQREWKYLSVFPEWPGSRGWLPVLIIPFNQELILRHGRQQPVSLGSRPYLCVVVQGVALLGEYTRRGQHGTNKRYGIFSTVNWTLMYDVENHRYANEFPSTVQVFHFKPKSRPLTTKRTSHLFHYHCPAIPPFDLPENMPTPDEVKFK
ncbi:hypothetical protein [Akkermansia sp.]